MDAAERTFVMKLVSLFGNFILLAVSTLALLALVLVVAIFSLPDVRQLEKCFTTSMFQVKVCPGSESYVRLKEISPYALHAVIVAEDGAFYTHQGFDWHEMEESFNANLRAGKFRRGGSTLTQQLAKNAFLDKEKSLWRKLKEAYLAMAIERRYPKDFILEKYLNMVEFGPNLYGIKAAAQLYFHKSPSALTPLEGAYLAHLLPNPKVYSRGFAAGKLTPFNRKMIATILRRMASFGKLSPEGYQLAVNELENFPWGGLSISSFQGVPTYSLEAKIPDNFLDDPIADEEALDEMLKEEERQMQISEPTPAPEDEATE
jgi:monofunctional biosynthetic peptidoglycan transglycosylase